MGGERLLGQLKLRLGHYLALVRSGEIITVTDRGTPVARLSPVPRPELPPALQELIEAGRAIYHPMPPYLPTPVRMSPGAKSAVDYVRDQRR
jgi:prevent-host-death family protein